MRRIIDIVGAPYLDNPDIRAILTTAIPPASGVIMWFSGSSIADRVNPASAGESCTVRRRGVPRIDREPDVKTRYVRYALLTISLGLVTYLALGFGVQSFEAFCPFGGMESLWGLFRAGEFSCALGPLNLSMLVAVLLLTLLAKKSFCGWACPIGFLGELCGHASGVLNKKKLRPGARLDMVLRLLRYVVLVVALVFTYKAGELILRGYDPFYLLFSGIGHGTAGVYSYVTLVILIVGAFAIPMFFCRYLCPLGAVLDPFSRLGFVKVYRDESKCTNCASCQIACPHDIPVHSLKLVRRRDCTNCLECVDACPEANVLSVRAGL